MDIESYVWSLPPEEVYAFLTLSKTGLGSKDVQDRLQEYGFNELPKPRSRTLLLRFFDQLTHLMAVLLWAAGILAFVSNTPELGWAIWGVILINGIFSFWQEYKYVQKKHENNCLKKYKPAYFGTSQGQQHTEEYF